LNKLVNWFYNCGFNKIPPKKNGEYTKESDKTKEKREKKFNLDKGGGDD